VFQLDTVIDMHDRASDFVMRLLLDLMPAAFVYSNSYTCTRNRKRGEAKARNEEGEFLLMTVSGEG
jgi:hypothetical protein